jgi:hypothetical protein
MWIPPAFIFSDNGCREVISMEEEEEWEEEEPEEEEEW